MAFFACGTRDKLNARPAGATRHFVDGGSLFGTGLTDMFQNLLQSLYRVSIKSRGQKTSNMSTDTLLVAEILTSN